MSFCREEFERVLDLEWRRSKVGRIDREPFPDSNQAIEAHMHLRGVGFHEEAWLALPRAEREKSWKAIVWLAKSTADKDWMMGVLYKDARDRWESIHRPDTPRAWWPVEGVASQEQVASQECDSSCGDPEPIEPTQLFIEARKRRMTHLKEVIEAAEAEINYLGWMIDALNGDERTLRHSRKKKGRLPEFSRRIFCRQLVSHGVDEKGMFQLSKAAGFADATSWSSFHNWFKRQHIEDGVSGILEGREILEEAYWHRFNEIFTEDFDDEFREAFRKAWKVAFEEAFKVAFKEDMIVFDWDAIPAASTTR